MIMSHDGFFRLVRDLIKSNRIISVFLSLFYSLLLLCYKRNCYITPGFSMWSQQLQFNDRSCETVVAVVATITTYLAIALIF